MPDKHTKHTTIQFLMKFLPYFLKPPVRCCIIYPGTSEKGISVHWTWDLAIATASPREMPQMHQLPALGLGNVHF